MTPELVDSHAHLAMLKDEPMESFLARAKEAGVTRLISVSTEPGDWSANRDAATRPGVWYTLGLHPHEAEKWKSCKPTLESFFSSGVPDRCVAIGEMGLDFYYDNAPKDAQIEALEDQLRLAKRVNLPVSIHCRDAFFALYDSIKRVGLGSRGGVLHCFTGTEDEAKRGIDVGLKVSFSGILTFKNAAPLREAAGKLPRDSILVETDCPFLAPIPMRGKTNEPAFLPFTVQTLALTWGESIETVAERTTRNAVELFHL